MTVTSKQEAWNKVNEIFPTDYEQDMGSSNRAGYPIYRSTADGHYYDYICDLSNRLEVNLDSSHQPTVNIWIEPIVWGVVAALGAYYGAMILINAVETISNGIKAISAAHSAMKAGATGAETAATFAATAAQYGFNAALMACPVFWIVAGIIAMISVIVAAVRALDVFGAKSHSVFGTLTGCINVAIQFFVNLGMMVANIALGIWNALGACCSNIGIAFHNVIANVKGWFYGLLETVLRVVEGVCKALNKIPFVSIDYSGITAKADEYAAKSAEAYGSVEDYKSVADAFNEGFTTFDAFSEGWTQDAFRPCLENDKG